MVNYVKNKAKIAILSDHNVLVWFLEDYFFPITILYKIFRN